MLFRQTSSAVLFFIKQSIYLAIYLAVFLIMLYAHFFCFNSYSFLIMDRKSTIKNNFKKHCKSIAHGTWCENGNKGPLKIDTTKKF